MGEAEKADKCKEADMQEDISVEEFVHEQAVGQHGSYSKKENGEGEDAIECFFQSGDPKPNPVKKIRMTTLIGMTNSWPRKINND